MNTTGVAVEPVTPSSGQWLLCRLGDRLLAVPLGCVIETMRPLPVQTFADLPAFVLGTSVVRGSVVPVVDLEAMLGVPSAGPSRFVTVTLEGRTVALAVDEVLGVRGLDASALAAVPPLLGELGDGVLDAIGTLDSGLLMMLGTARLLPETVWATLDAEAAEAAEAAGAGPAAAGRPGPA